MKLLYLLSVLFLLPGTSSAATVEIRDRSLIVDAHPFFVKGIAYNPTPIGQTSGEWLIEPSIYNRDLPIIKAMGANTIRTYMFRTATPVSKHLRFLDACHSNNLKVILGFTVYNPDSRDRTLAAWRLFVSKYKDHPAVLMWLFGNELNMGVDPVSPKFKSLFSLVGEARAIAHSIEGITRHPVSTAMADGSLDYVISTYDNTVDLWALQIYRGASFGGLWSTVRSFTNKPVLITEFGVDAFDNVRGVEDQEAQALYISTLYKEIMANNNVTSGSCLFQWADGWWKTGDRNKQSNKGSTCSSPNDKFCNDAWWGLHSIAPGTPNVLTPRKAYFVLQALFNPSPRPTPKVEPPPKPQNGCSDPFQPCGCCKPIVCRRQSEYYSQCLV